MYRIGGCNKKIIIICFHLSLEDDLMMIETSVEVTIDWFGVWEQIKPGHWYSEVSEVAVKPF